MPCQSPHLDEKTSAAPGISPGPVVDGEILLREMLNPDHVVEKVVQPSAVPLMDLRKRGFSVHRLDHVTRKFVEDSISEKLIRPFLRKGAGVGRRGSFHCSGGSGNSGYRQPSIRCSRHFKRVQPGTFFDLPLQYGNEGQLGAEHEK